MNKFVMLNIGDAFHSSEGLVGIKVDTEKAFILSGKHKFTLIHLSNYANVIKTGRVAISSNEVTYTY